MMFSRLPFQMAVVAAEVMVIPIGAEEHFTGVVDLIKMKAIIWDEASQGMLFDYKEIPAELVELAKEWRTDKILRHLEALLLVSDVTNMYIVSGNGDVVEPDEAIAAIGSGGPFAMAAATALLRNTQMPARQLVEQAMQIAAKICIYTNDSITYEELG